ncbi:MAG: nuclear transport factor 2 family protein [Deltaproteobacteria bacterium]|nr:nuclear transport factor 2 family protein [Deltaproteobacteria bacterium]
MPSSLEDQIVATEERLRQAMLHSDLAVLDELIAPELLFTTHDGHLVGKQDDLAFHRSGAFRFHGLEPSETRIEAKPQLAIVSVRMRLTGTYNGTRVAEDLRYTRVWQRTPGMAWQVIAGHASVVR